MPMQSLQSSSRGELVLPLLLAGVSLGLVAWWMPRGGWSAGVGVLALLMLLAVGVRSVQLQGRVSRIANEWQLIIDTVVFPVLSLDPDGRVVRMNRAAMKATGRSYRQNLGRRLAELGRGEPWRTSAALLPRAAGSGGPVVEEVRGEEGERCWEVTVQPVSRHHARGPGVRPACVVIQRDVTERVRLEESLRQQELMSALGSLVANVAHEARNPLFGINAGMEALEALCGDDPQTASSLTLLRESADHLHALMDALLHYGRPLEPSLRPGSLPELLREAVRAVEPMSGEAGVTVELAVAEELPALPMDRERLFQVFRNLLDNAVRHAPPGTEVTLSAGVAGGYAECEVRDRGAGFSDADLEHLFDPFYSRRPGGTGLGLAIVRRVIEEHGGEVEASNAPDGGARVRVRLPAAVEEGAAPAPEVLAG